MCQNNFTSRETAPKTAQQLHNGQIHRVGQAELTHQAGLYWVQTPDGPRNGFRAVKAARAELYARA